MSTEGKLGKVLLVASEACNPVQKCLLAAGGDIVKAAKGEDAISKAQHANFAVAVLVSTGRTMDMAETVFNLRDTRPELPIIIMALHVDAEEAEIVARACPNARSLATVDKLEQYLSSKLVRRTIHPPHHRI